MMMLTQRRKGAKAGMIPAPNTALGAELQTSVNQARLLNDLCAGFGKTGLFSERNSHGIRPTMEPRGYFWIEFLDPASCRCAALRRGKPSSDIGSIIK
jgi:hypothetical protein